MEDAPEIERSRQAAEAALPLVKADLAAAGIVADVQIHPKWSPDDDAAGVMVERGDEAPTYALWLRPGYDPERDRDDSAQDTWVVDVDPPRGRDPVRELHVVSDLAEARRLLIFAITADTDAPASTKSSESVDTMEPVRHARRNFIGAMLCLTGLIVMSIYGMQTDNPEHFWFFQWSLRVSVALALLTLVVGLLLRRNPPS